MEIRSGMTWPAPTRLTSLSPGVSRQSSRLEHGAVWARTRTTHSRTSAGPTSRRCARWPRSTRASTTGAAIFLVIILPLYLLLLPLPPLLCTLRPLPAFPPLPPVGLAQVPTLSIPEICGSLANEIAQLRHEIDERPVLEGGDGLLRRKAPQPAQPEREGRSPRCCSRVVHRGIALSFLVPQHHHHRGTARALSPPSARRARQGRSLTPPPREGLIPGAKGHGRHRQVQVPRVVRSRSRGGRADKAQDLDETPITMDYQFEFARIKEERRRLKGTRAHSQG